MSCLLQDGRIFQQGREGLLSKALLYTSVVKDSGNKNAKMKSSRVRRTPCSDIRSSNLSVFMVLSVVANGAMGVR